MSTIGTTLGLSTFGVFMMFKSMHHEIGALYWIPLTSFSFVIFVASCGILSLPHLVVAEVMPENIKEFGMAICTSLLWCFSFIMFKFLPWMITTFDLYGTMYFFAGITLFGSLFVMFYLPETKGKSHEEIMESLR